MTNSNSSDKNEARASRAFGELDELDRLNAGVPSSEERGKALRRALFNRDKRQILAEMFELELLERAKLDASDELKLGVPTAMKNERRRKRRRRIAVASAVAAALAVVVAIDARWRSPRDLARKSVDEVETFDAESQTPMSMYLSTTELDESQDAQDMASKEPLSFPSPMNFSGAFSDSEPSGAAMQDSATMGRADPVIMGGGENRSARSMDADMLGAHSVQPNMNSRSPQGGAPMRTSAPRGGMDMNMGMVTGEDMEGMYGTSNLNTMSGTGGMESMNKMGGMGGGSRHVGETMGMNSSGAMGGVGAMSMQGGMSGARSPERMSSGSMSAPPSHNQRSMDDYAPAPEAFEAGGRNYNQKTTRDSHEDVDELLANDSLVVASHLIDDSERKTEESDHAFGTTDTPEVNKWFSRSAVTGTLAKIIRLMDRRGLIARKSSSTSLRISENRAGRDDPRRLAYQRCDTRRGTRVAPYALRPDSVAVHST